MPREIPVGTGQDYIALGRRPLSERLLNSLANAALKSFTYGTVGFSGNRPNFLGIGKPAQEIGKVPSGETVYEGKPASLLQALYDKLHKDRANTGDPAAPAPSGGPQEGGGMGRGGIMMGGQFVPFASFAGGQFGAVSGGRPGPTGTVYGADPYTGKPIMNASRAGRYVAPSGGRGLPGASGYGYSNPGGYGNMGFATGGGGWITKALEKLYIR